MEVGSSGAGSSVYVHQQELAFSPFPTYTIGREAKTT